MTFDKFYHDHYKEVEMDMCDVEDLLQYYTEFVAGNTELDD